MGMYIKEVNQSIFESLGSDIDKYNQWIKKSRYSYYEYLEMLQEAAKKTG